MTDAPNGRKRLGWIITGVGLATTLVSVGLAYASYVRGIRTGEDQAVAQAAIAQKRLADVEVQAAAVADQMDDRLVVDAVQDTRLLALEKQHTELIGRLNKLIDVLWDRRRSEDARKPGE